VLDMTGNIRGVFDHHDGLDPENAASPPADESRPLSVGRSRSIGAHNSNCGRGPIDAMIVVTRGTGVGAINPERGRDELPKIRSRESRRDW